jgi:hypothetical protein
MVYVEGNNYRRLDARKELPLTGRTVGEFWAWAYSDVLTNISRAVLAEWIVGTALDATDGIRPAWEYYDLKYHGARIEVKSSAYLQNWKQKKLTRPNFDIALRGAWLTDSDYEEERERRADVYVFALYAEKDREKADPLNVAAWEFYVMATDLLNLYFGSQKSVALSRIQDVTKPVSYGDLRVCVDTVLDGG